MGRRQATARHAGKKHAQIASRGRLARDGARVSRQHGRQALMACFVLFASFVVPHLLGPCPARMSLQARPLIWIPACAGMTCVRGGAGRWSLPRRPTGTNRYPERLLVLEAPSNIAMRKTGAADHVCLRMQSTTLARLSSRTCRRAPCCRTPSAPGSLLTSTATRQDA